MNNYRSFGSLLAGCLLALLLMGCATTHNTNYMQDVQNGLQIPVEMTDIRLTDGDDIVVFVKAKDEVLTELFNVSTPMAPTQVVHTVDKDGNIEMAGVGKVAVKGLTRTEAAAAIKKKIVDIYAANDAVVSVTFNNLRYSVMGEVNGPGNFDIDKDQITLLEALSKAGDLTIKGQRENVMVIRQEGNQKKVYTVDLTSGKELMQSPAFYIRQNDVVYVSANKMRQREATVNGNNWVSSSFWLSLTSLAVTVAVLVFK
ncbi:MAG: polysaccharide biosynthesis/export family protein [Prevotella sp.]|nr:polysaccharide biosynthesis/export family protein [Prevotella sp.]